jgi:beta-fructofuranosidase
VLWIATASLAACAADPSYETIERAMKAVEAAAVQVADDGTRPVFHFRPPAHWMNDVCGGFYYKGWHHIFFQFHPFSARWGGGVGWGHARSKDLVHWEFLPPALLPDEHNGSRMDASGSAAFDAEGHPVLLFARSPPGRKREQWAALPVDEELIRWKRVDIGLVPGRSGVPENILGAWADMFVFQAGGRTFAIFKASGGMICEAQKPDLLEWQVVGHLQGIVGEMPNLFPLAGKHVLILSTFPISYRIGQFDADNIVFHSAGTDTRVLDYGPGPDAPAWKPRMSRGLYGTTVLRDAQGRSVLIGWVSGFRDDRGWNGCASLPRVLSIEDELLVQTPLPELAVLRDQESAWQGTLDHAAKVLPDVGGNTLEIQARFRPATATAFGLNLRPRGRKDGGVLIRLANGRLDVAGTTVPTALSADGTLKLRMFLDKSVLEVFIDGGRTSVTKVVYPDGEDLQVEAFAEGGTAEVLSLTVWTMKSVWR